MFIRLLFLCYVLKLVYGDNIAQRLVKRYNDVRSDCVGKYNNTTPAYECSGLLIRGLSRIGGGKQKYAWSKKPSNVRKNAFSVTFLRRDQQFSRFPHGFESGFIYYPHLKTPRGKNVYRVYCTFPVDAWTDYRTGLHGCREYYNDPTGRSGNCNAQGIVSITKWITHFQNVTRNREKEKYFLFGKYQCSFDMTRKDAARNFALSLEAKKYLRQYSRKYSWFHNEIIIKAWNENRPEKLPIEAFFYIIGRNYGRNKAFMYQQDYLKLSGQRIPVVGVRLPKPNDPNLIVRFDEKP